MDEAAKRVCPNEWCRIYFTGLEPLTDETKRLLAQILSATACERNWSAYKLVHNEKRNELLKKRARDLVHVLHNLRALKRTKNCELRLCG